MRDASVIRFTNRAIENHEFITLGLQLFFARGWQAWWRGRGVSYIYHSHREGTRPSQTDESFMRMLKDRWPHVDHLIFTPDRRYDIWRLT